MTACRCDIGCLRACMCLLAYKESLVANDRLQV